MRVHSTGDFFAFQTMTYPETLQYFYSQLPMYHRIGDAAFKKDLGNTIALCNHLGNPQKKFKSIHIGGTNGKGSCSHLIAAALQEAGFKVGLYTSPHYKDFRERIKVNGKYISKNYVCAFTEKNRSAFEEIRPSFFEMTVALAFSYFAEQKVDIAVIEVGLGGRLDSTNVILPELSVITNISYDHMQMLGNTLPKIAFEKAGIIKKNVPVVIGETHSESAPVFLQKAEEMEALILFADQHFAISGRADDSVLVSKNNLPYGKYFCDGGLSRASYQEKNLLTAIAAIDQLEKGGWKVNAAHLQKALFHLTDLVKFMGRWQKLANRPLTIADSGHNEAGVKTALDQLSGLEFNHLHVVMGFVNDKDVDKVLSLYPTNATYYFAKANIPRGLDAVLLREMAAAKGLKGRKYSSVKNAFSAARRNAKGDDMILVLGSIFVVAEVL